MATNATENARTRDEYTVGWVTALPTEQVAAIAMLDQRHADLPRLPDDHNIYTLGSIGSHNVVVACLPKGRTGPPSAAFVAMDMVKAFPSIRIPLLVGIGGGIPANKIRLGDVVVGVPGGAHPGVIKWDKGKAIDGGGFERTGSLDKAPASLLTALSKLEAEHRLQGSEIPIYLKEAESKFPRLAGNLLRSPELVDILFKKGYSHINKPESSQENEDNVRDEEDEDGDCRFCDKSETIKRKPREMQIHYGLIASGDQVIKDASRRDRINEDLGGKVLCVETEAAGLMDRFPCMVIRGISDYADSHKNDAWQEHAAAVAAAFAKELLLYIPINEIQMERTVKDILDLGP
jgi:nucleoside phosphorylase